MLSYMKNIFISYSRHDISIVESIKREIESLTKQECWMDLEGISYESQDFADKIVEAIRDCSIFLFMLSDASQQSRIACGEIALAQKIGKSIFLVNITNCELTDKFTILYSNHNLCNYSVESEKKKLVVDICSSLKIKSPYNTLLHPIKIGQLYGLADDEDNIIIKGTWLNISEFNDGVAFARCRDNRYCLIDHYGKQLFQDRWLNVKDFKNGVARVLDESGLWGYITSSGQWISACQWKSASDFSEGLACVVSETLKGYIDITGRIVFKYTGEEIYPFSEGLACVRDDSGKCGYINKDGLLVIACQWDKASAFNNGLATIIDGNKYGYIDRNGEFKIPLGLRDSDLTPIEDPQTHLWGYADSKGLIVIPCEWNDARYFSEGLACVEKNGVYGFIDYTGTLVIPRRFLFAGDFKNGIAKITDCTKVNCSYVDKEGNIF